MRPKTEEGPVCPFYLPFTQHTFTVHLLCSQLCVCVWKGGIQINIINRSASREMFRLMGFDKASSCLKDSVE